MSFQNWWCIYTHFIDNTKYKAYMLLLSHKVIPDSAAPWTAVCQAYLSSTISQNLLRFMSIKSMMLSNHLVLCCPLFLLPSVFPSINICSNELTLCIRWWKYWSFSFAAGLPMNFQGWFPLGSIVLMPLLSKGLWRVSLTPHFESINSLAFTSSLWSNSHVCRFFMEKP